MKNISGKLGIVILGLAVVVSGAALFFEDQFSALASFLSHDDYVNVDESGKILKIAYLFPPNDLNPFSADISTQKRLLDVYEPLVRADNNLNIKPVLAISYGIQDENTWEIYLRPGVKFHDGSNFDVQDVIYSFNLAKDNVGGVADELLAVIESYEAVGESGLLLKTVKPDPLLLNKLSKLLIVPEGFTDFEEPVGTGSYILKDTNDLSDLGYERNINYWGAPAYFSKVRVFAIPDKVSRVELLLDGEIDFLVDVPPDSVENIKEKGLSVEMMPSLEVGFVMFNFRNKTFAQKTVRMAVAKALNKESFLDLAFGYAKTVNQFVSNGVFGYNPDLSGYTYDREAAEDDLLDISDGGFQKIRVKFSYPQSLKLLGQYFREQLELVGMQLELAPLSDQELQELLQQQKLTFYYLGWRHESGDALPFLKAVLHSKNAEGYGMYNGMNYINTEVDDLIEKSETNFNLQERLEDMQMAMKIAVQDDIVGVPLFETQSIFAFDPDLSFTPRVDSLVFPSIIKSNK